MGEGEEGEVGGEMRTWGGGNASEGEDGIVGYC